MYEDPGWRKAVKRALVPFSQLIPRLRARSSADPLTATRQIFLGVVLALPLFAFVLFFIVPPDQWFAVGKPPFWIWIVVGYGVVSLAWIQRIRAPAA